MKENIQLVRVDNRLVHGQVAVTWSATLSISMIVVVDDEVAHDILAQKLMQTIARTINLKMKFFSVQDFIQFWQEESNNKKMFVVVKTIQMAKALVEGGVYCPKINIGNIHYEKGRIPLNNKMYLTKQDVEDIHYLCSNGCEVFYQDVPGTKIEKLDTLIYEDLVRRKRHDS